MQRVQEVMGNGIQQKKWWFWVVYHVSWGKSPYRLDIWLLIWLMVIFHSFLPDTWRHHFAFSMSMCIYKLIVLNDVIFYFIFIQVVRFPRWLSGKKSACQYKRHRDVCLIPEMGRFPGVGNGNPLQHSCLETPWIEEPGGLQSMESQRGRSDWSHTYTHTDAICWKPWVHINTSEPSPKPKLFHEEPIFRGWGWVWLLALLINNTQLGCSQQAQG